MLSGLDTSGGNMMTLYRAVLISSATSNEMRLKCESGKGHVYIPCRKVVYKSPPAVSRECDVKDIQCWVLCYNCLNKHKVGFDGRAQCFTTELGGEPLLMIC